MEEEAGEEGEEGEEGKEIQSDCGTLRRRILAPRVCGMLPKAKGCDDEMFVFVHDNNAH